MSATSSSPGAGFTLVFGDVGFNKYVGPIWRSPDGVEFIFDVRDIHLNGGGTMHGGMAMALADIVMGRTVRDALEDDKGLTISLNCDLIGPAKLGDRIKGTAQIVRRTRSIVFISSELSVGSRTILIATGLWKILGSE